MREVFEDSLKGAADLLTEQLELAKAKEHPVQVSYRPLLIFNFRGFVVEVATDNLKRK